MLMKRIQELNVNIMLVFQYGLNNRNYSDSNTDIGVLSNKYERALLEIGKMYDDNTKLQDQINHLV